MLRCLCTTVVAVLSIVACAPESGHPVKASAVEHEVDGGSITDAPPRTSDAPQGAALPALADDEDEIPCGPRAILQTICQQCHARPRPLHGAPFPIVRRSDIIATRGGKVVRDLMIAQLEARWMPARPVTMDDVSREVLLSWLRSGAEAVSARECPADVRTPEPPPKGFHD